MVLKDSFNYHGPPPSNGFSIYQGKIVTNKPVESSNIISASNVISGFIAMATIDDTMLTSNSSGNQYYTGAGKIYYLPSVSLLPLGTKYNFINEGTGDMTILNCTGEAVGTVLPGDDLTVMLIDKAVDVAASWYKYGGGTMTFAQVYLPTLYTTGPSTYTSQMGSWTGTSFDGVNFMVSVSFRLIVGEYESDSNTCTFLLPLLASSEATQFVSFNNIQGSSGIEPGAEYSARISFGSIMPGSDLVVLHTNYTLAPGDLWVGNFVYNAIM